ncbi:MAG TPA: hypothetical protein VF645_13060, partial [Allosphingosinicella sp.]
MSDPAHLELALGALALRLRREVEVMRVLRSPERRDQFLGLILGEEDAALLCDEIAGRTAAGCSDGLDASVADADRRVRESRAADPSLTINRLAAAFGLDRLEQDLLVLAAAPAIDPRFGLVYGFLADDLARRAMTPALAQRILADTGVGLLALRAACEAGGRLRRNALVAPEAGDQPLMAAPLRCDERVLDLLMGRDRCDPALMTLIERDCIDPATAAALGAVEAPLDRPVALVETGAADVLLWTLQAAHRVGLRVDRLDWRRWAALPEASIPGLLARALRDSRLAGAAPLLRGWDKAPPSVRAAVASAQAPLAVTGSAELWAES